MWRARRQLAITFLALTIGFAALILSLGMRDSQILLVSSKAREILTGDAQVSGTRPLTEDERATFENHLKPTAFSPETDLVATVRDAGRAAMVELKAVGDSYPLIGQIYLTDNRRAHFNKLKVDEIWLADELRTAYGLSKGQYVELGQARFKIADWIIADIGVRRGATGFAPRAYIRHEALPATELIQPGSQVQYRLTVLLPHFLDQEKRIKEIEGWPEELVIRSPSDAIEGVKRGIVSVERYLGLLTLFIMLLGFVTGFYLLQIHLRNRAQSFALSLLFGARPRAVEFGAVLQILTLLTAAWILGLFLIVTTFALLNPSVRDLLPVGAELLIGWRGYFISLGVLALNIVIFALPFAARLRRLEPKTLLDQATPDLPMVSLWKDLAPYGLALIGYSVLSSWLLDSIALSATILITLGVLLALATLLIPYVTRRFANRPSSTGPHRLSLLGLARPRLITTLMWLSLAWSAALCAAIPNLLAMAKDELRPPARVNLPQLFVINLRGQDVDPLAKTVADKGGELRHVSPLVLGRLIKRNGTSLSNERVARFPVRLTYRSQLSSAERVIEGTPLPTRYSGEGLPGVSVEQDFADRNGFKIGDHLEFEVAGLPLTAIVANLREVKWNTFQPNFFIQFAGGVIEDFPKSFIGVIYGLDPQEILTTQGSISSQFPTLSLLNLATTLDRLSDLASKMLWPILAVSLGGLLFILLMVALLAGHLWQEQGPERALYHRLGANRDQILKLFSLETLWLAGSALLFGNIVGLGVAIIGGNRVFDQWQVPQQLDISLLIALVSLALCYIPSSIFRFRKVAI